MGIQRLEPKIFSYQIPLDKNITKIDESMSRLNFSLGIESILRKGKIEMITQSTCIGPYVNSKGEADESMRALYLTYTIFYMPHQKD